MPNGLRIMLTDICLLTQHRKRPNNQSDKSRRTIQIVNKLIEDNPIIPPREEVLPSRGCPQVPWYSGFPTKAVPAVWISSLSHLPSALQIHSRLKPNPFHAPNPSHTPTISTLQCALDSPPTKRWPIVGSDIHYLLVSLVSPLASGGRRARLGYGSRMKWRAVWETTCETRLGRSWLNPHLSRQGKWTEMGQWFRRRAKGEGQYFTRKSMLKLARERFAC